jgi:methylenetetrahydrofolate--tRNA-(uracil-5-)-methyltransferase
LKFAEQDRVLRMIPGLGKAEFVRYGQMHRNTFLNSPSLLHPTMEFRSRVGLFFAGQIVGVEGYVGNAATGLLAGLNAVQRLQGQPLWVLPETTMLGALCHYVTHAEPKHFQPMKANFGLLPRFENPPRDKQKRAQLYSERAQNDLRTWMSDVSLATSSLAARQS